MLVIIVNFLSERKFTYLLKRRPFVIHSRPHIARVNGTKVQMLYPEIQHIIFFNCYLAVPWPTLGHSCGDSLTNQMLITVFCTYLT